MRVAPDHSLRSLRSLRLIEKTMRYDSTAENAENAKKGKPKGKNMKDIKLLCDQVRQISYDIHRYHGHGHLEKVYENALAHRLEKAGLVVKKRHPINVFDEDGTLIGDYFADLLVEDCLVVELKTARTLAPEHEAQL